MLPNPLNRVGIRAIGGLKQKDYIFWNLEFLRFMKSTVIQLNYIQPVGVSLRKLIKKNLKAIAV